MGVTAGLVAGGTIGLFALAPTLSSAATEDPPTEEPADDAADTAGTDDPAEPNDPASGDTRPAPGERIREVLQPLVDDGTIDAAQADAVASHLAEQRPERPGRRGMRPGFDGEIVADLLGIDAADLRQELRAGNSIAEIAAANGVDAQVVIDALVDEASAHLDLAVENGRLTEDEAADQLTHVESRITARVNGERP